MNVVIVDADSWRRDDIAKVLKRKGHTVTTVGYRDDLPQNTDVVFCYICTEEDLLKDWKAPKVVLYGVFEAIPSETEYFQLPFGQTWSPSKDWQRKLAKKVREVIRA
jgi:hypothetical protein